MKFRNIVLNQITMYLVCLFIQRNPPCPIKSSWMNVKVSFSCFYSSTFITWRHVPSWMSTSFSESWYALNSGLFISKRHQGLFIVISITTAFSLTETFYREFDIAGSLFTCVLVKP